MESEAVMESYSPTPTRTCVTCGRAISFEANVCPYCGHDYRIPAYAAVVPTKRSSLPVIGGILIFIAGILAIAMGAFYFTLDPNDIEDSGATLPPGYTAEDLESVVNICGSVCVVFGLIAVVGAIFAFKRKYFALSVIGGIFGLLGMGFLLGALLSLIGMILVLVARKEFQ